MILNPNKLVSFDPRRVDGIIDIQPISETIVTGIPVQLINKPNDVNVFVNPATVSLTIVGGLDQIANTAPENIDVIIDFDTEYKPYILPTLNISYLLSRPDMKSKAWEDMKLLRDKIKEI